MNLRQMITNCWSVFLANLVSKLMGWLPSLGWLFSWMMLS